ncbi:MAG: hypothetical protein K2N77_03030, partial [Lachnospiraceae bacterium]|nr:hypothetical protein [Lachnospiraceae bacterium]
MHKNISRSNKRGGQSRKRRRKNRIQLCLNMFMLVCIGIGILCIGKLRNRESTADGDFRGYARRIEYTADESKNGGIPGGSDNALGHFDSKLENFD